MADVKNKKEHAKKEYSKSNEKGKEQIKKKPFGYHFMPYIFAVLTVWLILCFVTTLICNPGDILGNEGRVGDHILGWFGYYTSAVFMGILGYAAFAIPVIFVLFIVFWKNYNRRSFVALNMVLAFVAVAVISALCHIFTNIGEGIHGFTYDIPTLYRDGVALTGGGIIGGLLGFALFSGVKIGSIYILIAVLIPVALFLFGTTPVEAFYWIVERIKAARKKAKERAKERKEEKRVREQERREREKQDRIAAREQDKLDREAAREQERLDREAAREQERLDREAAREEALEEKRRKQAEKEAEKRDSSDSDEGTGCKIKINNVDDPDPIDDTDGEYVENADDEIDDGMKLEYKAFSDETKDHKDGIRDETDENNDDADDKEEEIEKKKNITTVFVNNKVMGKNDRGLDVDDMASEIYEKNGNLKVGGKTVQVDKETGEIIEDKPKTQKPVEVKIPEYKFPPIELLEAGSSKYSSDPAEIENNAELLRGVLQDFRIPIKEISCSCGPTITRYEIKPEAGVRVRQIAGLVDDISMALAKSGVRIEAPIPGKAAVGVEVPNDKPAAVKLRNILETGEFMNHKSKLASCLGADVSGRPMIFDIEKMPHLLVAGTTGSGKSVMINSIIMSILYHAKPSEVKLLLIDPKKVEFKVYRDIPHLCCRIVSDPKKAAGALNSAVNEMEKRFALIEEVGVRNITGYNEITKNDPEKPYMPRLVIIIDEFADLMMTAKDEVETAVVRIAQKARAAGIHLIIGTQRPSVDVITGLIKANIPSRIAFTVMSGIDSRTILDTVGAEKLCGRGDMLYAPVGAQKPARVQGAFVSDEEVERVVEYVKDHNAPVMYDQEFETSIDVEAARCGNTPEKSSGGGEFVGGGGSDDALLFDAAELAIDTGKIATSMLQRRLSIGYGRAAKIIDRLEEMGVVGPPDGTKPRSVLMTREQFEALKTGETE